MTVYELHRELWVPHPLPKVFDFLERKNLPRMCVYHLVYSGRGSDIAADDVERKFSRSVVDSIIDRAEYFHKKGFEKDLLTIDNHCDGPYLIIKLRKRGQMKLADDIYQLLLKQGGFEHVTAADPDAALTALDQRPIDLVIQDMNFSRSTTGEEGLRLLHEIRRRRPALPVVQPEGGRLSYEEWAEDKIRRVVPLARWQTPEDVAAMAVFLASARAGNVTGQTINVDGGFVMHW